MKKILAIIFCILFIAFGFALRGAQKDNQKLELKNAIKEYEKASTESEGVKAELINQKNLNNNETDKLDDLEQKHKELLKQFDEYKAKYPENTTEEIKKMESENKEYSKKVSDLENNVKQLDEKVVKQQQVVLSSSNNTVSPKNGSNSGSSNYSSSSGGSSNSSNTGNSSNVSNTGNSSNGSSSSESSETVYANGGSSRSNKYHSSPTVHNMEGAIAMSKSEAISRGYVACKKCY
jgi:hypothetical protein